MRTCKITLAAISLLAMCGAVAAADLSGPPPTYKAPLEALPSWTGVYAGFNAGGAFGLGQSDFSIAGVAAFATAKNDVAGGIGGGQVGYNWQAGMTVLGVETDFQASGVRGSLRAPCLPLMCGIPLTATYTQRVPWFGTVRGRVGVASNAWLIYVTAGYAYAQLGTDASAVAGPATATLSLRETRNGWTAGGGIEVALAAGWSAKLEYLYLDLGRTSTGLVFPGLPVITDDARFTMNVVRAGLNYRFY